MSNFQCPHCGMTNIDCGWSVFKTPKEIELEEKIKKIRAICETNLQVQQCNSCDGVGLDDGCQATSCATYQINEILKIIGRE